jgi:hypothetical protein
MKKKFWVAVPEEKQAEVISLLSRANISYTSKSGKFAFDLISFIIGFVLALIFGIVVF